MRRQNHRGRESTKQITNNMVKVDPEADPKLEMKQSLASLGSRVTEAPLKQVEQQEANLPSLLSWQRLERVFWSACVSSPETRVVNIKTTSANIKGVFIVREKE